MREFLLLIAGFFVGLAVGVAYRHVDPASPSAVYSQEPAPRSYRDDVEVPPGAWVEPPGIEE